MILDLIILKSRGNTPKDHSERFRILKQHLPKLYGPLDKNFKIYQDTYSISIDKQTCDSIREYVRQIIKEYKIEL